ncbi:hypothetical protein MPSEU_000693800 [Mayamaea pseudoterrestris]|nr:hypothetical protein MPSEU_000693800 [Mayamaea pseudoterrestris]
MTCRNTLILFIAVFLAVTSAFSISSQTAASSRRGALRSPQLSAILSGEGRKTYDPKWKKKQTLAEQGPPLDLAGKGIKGTINVRFQQGNSTKLYLARPGQPLRDVALQAGQFIKYGCGKGECGTCEALCNGKWIRPCTTVVPADLAEGSEYVVIVNEIKSKATTASGKFYSVRSFLMGFYTNVLGMIGFVAWRKKAKKNWGERREYEDLIKQKTLAKKQSRQQQQHGDLAP